MEYMHVYLCMLYGYAINKVKSGDFGHQVNSDIDLQTVENQIRRLLMGRLIRIYTVCLFTLFCYFKN